MGTSYNRLDLVGKRIHTGRSSIVCHSCMSSGIYFPNFYSLILAVRVIFFLSNFPRSVPHEHLDRIDGFSSPIPFLALMIFYVLIIVRGLAS